MVDETWTHIEEEVIEGTRREWLMSGREYTATLAQREVVVEAIREMHWQRPDELMAMSPALMLQELILTLDIKRVAQIGYSLHEIRHPDCEHPFHPDHWASYMLIGFRVRHRDAWWSAYFLDIGLGAVWLVNDFTVAPRMLTNVSVACGALEWHDRCKGSFKEDDGRRPCECTCGHPHIITSDSEEATEMTHTPLFPSGRLVSTPGGREVMERIGYEAFEALYGRHLTGDWGTVPDEDKTANDQAVLCGERIHSSYGDGDNKLWIITEADRSVTTILTPDEY